MANEIFNERPEYDYIINHFMQSLTAFFFVWELLYITVI